VLTPAEKIHMSNFGEYSRLVQAVNVFAAFYIFLPKLNRVLGALRVIVLIDITWINRALDSP
jgi:hypothetical protein